MGLTNFRSPSLGNGIALANFNDEGNIPVFKNLLIIWTRIGDNIWWKRLINFTGQWCMFTAVLFKAKIIFGILYSCKYELFHVIELVMLFPMLEIYSLKVFAFSLTFFRLVLCKSSEIVLFDFVFGLMKLFISCHVFFILFWKLSNLLFKYSDFFTRIWLVT